MTIDAEKKYEQRCHLWTHQGIYAYQCFVMLGVILVCSFIFTFFHLYFNVFMFIFRIQFPLEWSIVSPCCDMAWIERGAHTKQNLLKQYQKLIHKTRRNKNKVYEFTTQPCPVDRIFFALSVLSLVLCSLHSFENDFFYWFT